MKMPFAVAVVPFAAAVVPLLAPRPVAVPGPGGVITAAHDLVRAIDARDEAALRDLLVDYGDGGGFCATVADDGAITQRDDGRSLHVIDVDAAGRCVDAGDRAAAAKLLAGSIAARDAAIRTTIRSVRADCPGERCSWATLELERRTTTGGTTVVQPLFATMLVRWVGGEGPAMKIWHWHCAPAGPARSEAAKQNG